MLADCDGPGLMTLRIVALVMALALALPAVILIIRGVRAERRPLEVVWAAAPVGLLVALVALAAAAG